MVKAFALLLALGCTHVVEIPRVVTVVVPYVAVLPLEAERDSTMLGKQRCDLNGNPTVFVDTTQTPETQRWILTHEAIHVAQTRVHGGCKAFGERYRDDANFRLMVESEAFCQVALAQQAAGVKVWPDRRDIIWRLQFRYGLLVLPDSIEKAVRC